jgi:outer membrane protein assembly factor BamB
VTKPPVPGLPYTGTGDQADESIGGKGVITAIDPFSGDVCWKYILDGGSASAGVLGTAGGVLFAGSRDGYLLAFDSRTGKLLRLGDSCFADFLFAGRPAVCGDR